MSQMFVRKTLHCYGYFFAPGSSPRRALGWSRRTRGRSAHCLVPLLLSLLSTTISHFSRSIGFHGHLPFTSCKASSALRRGSRPRRSHVVRTLVSSIYLSSQILPISTVYIPPVKPALFGLTRALDGSSPIAPLERVSNLGILMHTRTSTHTRTRMHTDDTRTQYCNPRTHFPRITKFK